MPLDRRTAALVRTMDEHDLRQLVILARGRLEALGGPRFEPASGEPSVTYRQQAVRCNKPTCTRCPHGPYWYAYWREDGRVRSRYVGKNLPQ
ncbi:MAG TPA: hypothetical protein VFA94_03750 [Acidimicrobiales bacterium]|nr:hypothetical protein [Acidimicrobiales bacterium]